jgi:predicted permease
MPRLLHDLRYGLRTLIRTPGFTVMAVIVLSLGIGVNATVFSLANELFLRPLSVAAPDTLVRVYSNRWSNVRYRTYLDLRDRNGSLQSLAAFQLQSFGLRIDADVEPVFGEIVSGEYFPMLGVAPARGRLIAPSDDRPGQPPVVVLSHAFWTRRFGSAADAVGRTIDLNGQPFTIVGVTRPDFTGVLAPLRGALWVPLSSDSLLRPALDQDTRLDSSSFHLIGRLKPGVAQGQAQADLDGIGRQLRSAQGDTSEGPAVTVYGATMLHPEISGPVSAFTAVLAAVVALVLLIVCVNVANLVLARAANRDMELAVRQSLGAGRGRLIRQLLTENLLLSIGGAAGGLAIAYWGTRAVAVAQLPAPVPLALTPAIDWRVLAYTTLVAVAATLAFGVAPAIGASRIDLVRALKGIGADGPKHGRLRSAFLVSQVALSVLLLVAAGLFIRSFRHAESLDVGFDGRNVIIASVDLETRGYSESRGLDFVRRLIERLEASPGIVAANALDIVPVTLSNTATYMLRDTDADPPPNQPSPTPLVNGNAIGPGHFRTLQIDLLAGRDFSYADGPGPAGVAIVNETLARRFWPGESALGKRLRPLGSTNPVRDSVEVVGVVRDSTYVTVGEDPRPFLYRPLAQVYTPRVTLLVRSTLGTESALATIRAELRALDPGLPLFNANTLADATAISLLPARVAGTLLAVLGALALALAALGIYGVLAYLVRARTREIGVRVAIGAPPRAVAAMVVRQAITWTAVGAAIGVLLALGLTRFLASFLYGIDPLDPLTFAGVLLVLGIVACVASAVPAVRASRLDPLVALRTL